jgi:hypothetical protein
LFSNEGKGKIFASATEGRINCLSRFC